MRVHYRKISRHQQNRKHITCRNAARRGSSNIAYIRKICCKFGRVGPETHCGNTDREAHLSKYSVPLPGWGVIITRKISLTYFLTRPELWPTITSSRPTYVFSLLRRLSKWRCPHLLLSADVGCTAPAARPQLSIYISCLQGAQQQTRRTPLLLLIHAKNGRTDRRTLDRYIDLFCIPFVQQQK